MEPILLQLEDPVHAFFRGGEHKAAIQIPGRSGQSASGKAKYN
jgi:hypothetical protein